MYYGAFRIYRRVLHFKCWRISLLEFVAVPIAESRKSSWGSILLHMRSLLSVDSVVNEFVSFLELVCFGVGALCTC
jgi:hypothetical protein